MIAAALLMTAAVESAPPAADEIVVTAEKLRKIRISADTDGNGRVTTCQVTVSSGDGVLDRYACEATRDCAAAGISAGEAVGDCVDQRMIAFAGLPGARKGTRNGTDASNR